MHQSLPDEGDLAEGMMMKTIAVFASGTGSNFAAIVKAVKQKKLRCAVRLLVCDNPQAGVLAKAEQAGVPAMLVQRKDYADKAAFEAAIISRLKQENIGLVVLAGYMRMLSPAFVKQFAGRIINIHPALLPSFKGTQAIEDALAYGVKVTGVTVHFVDEEMDHGPIIMQQAVAVKPNDTPASLAKRIHAVEHILYPKAVQACCNGKIKLTGRNVSF